MSFVHELYFYYPANMKTHLKVNPKCVWIRVCQTRAFHPNVKPNPPNEAIAKGSRKTNENNKKHNCIILRVK
jgi:hypothetical protein